MILERLLVKHRGLQTRKERLRHRNIPAHPTSPHRLRDAIRGALVQGIGRRALGAAIAVKRYSARGEVAALTGRPESVNNQLGPQV